MNTYEDELKKKWNGINYHDGGALQLAVDHSLDWYVRYASRNHKSIVIVSDTPADKISSSKSIETACNRRRDGKFAISFTLINKEQEDVFITMSSDIIEFSKNEPEPKESLQRVLRRYSAWAKLFDRKRSALLSDNAQKGLISELCFLKEEIEKGMKPSAAIEGWVGPEGADQDFVYEDGWHEIKSTGAASSQITVSSVEQLDNSEAGELVVFRVDKCAPAHAGAITLFGMVRKILGMLAAESSVIDEFVLKLGSAGYIDMREYDKQNFNISSRRSYCVDESFPRIVRSDLPVEVINVQYQLNLPSLNSWAKQ